MKGKVLTILGFVATAIGMGATLLTTWVEDKKLDEKIDEKLKEALAEQNNEEES